MIAKNLNKSQQEAVDYSGGPLLIVAGAGSGKTKTLTGRLAAILESGVLPKNIIAITFTNKAADEMADRVNKLISSDLPFIGTFHSLGARILKRESDFFGRASNFSIFDADDSLRLIKTMIKNFNISEDRRDFNPLVLRKEFSRIKSELRGADEIEIFFNEYENLLKKNNAFDFDDLIEKPVKLFQEQSSVLEKYQNKFQHILVDEFQDTNTAQYQFIKLLAQRHNNLSVVGDDQQAIYGFRHADFRIFLNFEKDWPKTKTIFLEQNYRSTGNIISAANAVIANNKFQKPKNLWTKCSEGETVKIIEHQEAVSEADWIAERIFNSQISERVSAAILYRTNAQSRAIEAALIERGIGYLIFGGLKFYERKEIKDIIAGLRWSFNKNDLISLERLEKNFNKKTFSAVKKEISEIIGQTPPKELIGRFLESADYFNYLKKNYLNADERVENIKELIYFASGFNDLGEFLERVSLFQSSDGSLAKELKNTNKPFVNLMTIHLSKGLEFDEVYIVGANEGLLPHERAYASEAGIEEERRLMYVAMTRAKKRLYLNFYHLPSRFLSEIPSKFVEFIGGRALDNEERYISID